ncbi:MAG TPA: lipid-binding SYLF domain-containing protein [Candidatus Acidoferrum sp.]|nr:lipid-binding SYLF domain-containing protein [Candidatus Acidoferrum sp.]
MNKKRCVTLLGVLAGVFALLIPTSSVGDTHSEKDRLQNAGKVMKEVLNIPDDIPSDLLSKARCVVVMPSVLKAAFIVGASYGRGAMVCRTGRNFTGPWGAPAMYALEGGNLGLQAGGEATDYVFLVINDRGADSLLHSKVKLGADVSVAGGPKGRTTAADTDAFMRSEILAYSRARGVFAGVAVEGSTLRPDNGANHDLYGRKITAAQIIRESSVKAPEAGRTLTATLEKASPRLNP